MNKTRMKTTATLLIAIFMISIFAVAIQVSAVTEWTVDDDGPADFDTIQAAINAAGSGDTIIVAAGLYEEEVKIRDKSLTLLGAQADVPIVDGEREGEESIIRGKGTTGLLGSWCVVRIQHSDVVVNGFTIENGKRGIAIQGPCENILVSYNHIEGSGIKGISRDDAAVDITIDHNYIASNPIGISTRGGATTITDNTFYGNGIGIKFHHGDPSSYYYPDDYYNPNYPTIISGNTFTNDGTSIYLNFRGHQLITITGNDITEARAVAILTDGWGEDLVNPAIHYNNIWDNEFGIRNMAEEIELDATLNWWGHASGPSVVGLGSGDTVSTYVDYDPWLAAPYPSKVTGGGWFIDDYGSDNKIHFTVQAKGAFVKHPGNNYPAVYGPPGSVKGRGSVMDKDKGLKFVLSIDRASLWVDYDGPDTFWVGLKGQAKVYENKKLTGTYDFWLAFAVHPDRSDRPYFEISDIGYKVHGELVDGGGQVIFHQDSQYMSVS